MSGIRMTLLSAGYCTAPEWIARSRGGLGALRFPATFALLEHPARGPMLLDTGYAPRFREETARFPYTLYAAATPVTLRPGASAVEQLARRGVDAADIETIFISHFHGDHLGGLRDFPRARLVFLPHAYADVRGRSGMAAVRRAFVPALLPPDFESRAAPVPPSAWRPVPAELAPFEAGVDLLGDGSLWALELPGHAVGQMGLHVRREDGGETLLAVDACWTSEAYRENRLPHPLANPIFADPAAYRRTLGRLHAFHQRRPEVAIIPAHCEAALARYGAGEGDR